MPHRRIILEQIGSDFLDGTVNDLSAETLLIEPADDFHRCGKRVALPAGKQADSRSFVTLKQLTENTLRTTSADINYVPDCPEIGKIRLPIIEGSADGCLYIFNKLFVMGALGKFAVKIRGEGIKSHSHKYS